MATQITPTGTANAQAEAPATLTITYYQQLAEQVTAALDAASAIVPPLDEREFAGAADARRRLNIPIEFLGTAIVSVERIPALQAVRKLDVRMGRDTLQYIDAFRPVVDKLVAFTTRLLLTLQTRQAALTGEALQIYDIAKGLGRDSKDPEVGAAVAALQRDLGRRGRRQVPLAVRKAAKEAGAAASAAVIASATLSAPPSGGTASTVAEPRVTAARR